jgi:hypothetical protein
MKRGTILISTICLFLALLVSAGCAPGPDESTEHDAGDVAICDLNADLIGWRVTTIGQISFIDLSPPDGVYFELDDGGCEIGAFVHNEFWLDFSDEQQAQMALDNDVEIEGILTRENDRLIVSVQELVGLP